MRKVAFVSSFDTRCGNASFTKVVMESLNSHEGIQTFIEELDITLNHSLDKIGRKAADRKIAEIAKRLKDYDSVNIQFEASLLGLIPKQIVKRLRKIIKANPNTTLTFHSPRLINNSNSKREMYKSIVRGSFRTAARHFLGDLRANKDSNLNRKVAKILRQYNIPVVVHTDRSRSQLTELFQISRVSVHPLQFVDDETKISKVKLPKGKNIGVFGFISRYKGLEDAVKALSLLPPEWNLVIVGRIHPQQTMDIDANNYLNELNEMVLALKLQKRVFFLGDLPDEEFYSVARSVNCCLLAYQENGQDGSGIASICLELNSQVVCSNSRAFDELFRLVPTYSAKRYDFGNSLQLSQQILSSQQSTKEFIDRKVFTLQTQTELYLEILS